MDVPASVQPQKVCILADYRGDETRRFLKEHVVEFFNGSRFVVCCNYNEEGKIQEDIWGDMWGEEITKPDEKTHGGFRIKDSFDGHLQRIALADIVFIVASPFSRLVIAEDLEKNKDSLTSLKGKEIYVCTIDAPLSDQYDPYGPAASGKMEDISLKPLSCSPEILTEKFNRAIGREIEVAEAAVSVSAAKGASAEEPTVVHRRTAPAKPKTASGLCRSMLFTSGSLAAVGSAAAVGLAQVGVITLSPAVMIGLAAGSAILALLLLLSVVYRCPQKQTVIITKHHVSRPSAIGAWSITSVDFSRLCM